MIITCPHCQTKYQVTYEAIGSVGRKVQCAQCQQAWQQDPLDRPEPTQQQRQAFDAIAEDGLDEAMEAEEKAASAEQAQRRAKEKKADEDRNRASAAAGKVDPAVIRRRQRAFSRRQNAMAAELPLARLRRTLRVLGVLMLAGIGAIFYFGRVQVVDRFPEMAGVYASIGLGVNVVGLDFSNVTTLRTLRNGKDVLVVSAQIVGQMPSPVPVPAVVVTLLDTGGQDIYEWSVTPMVRDLMAGERATFDTQLTLPPVDAARVRLSFAGAQIVRATGAAEPPPAPAADGTAEAPPAAQSEYEPAAATEDKPAAATEHNTTPELQ